MDRETLEQRVVRFIQEHHLALAGETMVVGVSGGADSVCLVHVLWQCQRELGVKLHVAHLNHQLRGAESDADARHVSELASCLNIPSIIECCDVAAYRDQKHCSLEEAAREMRYKFMAKVAGVAGASRIVVGHTRDDQVETILMHLLRGTGVAGLRGLQPQSSIRCSEDGDKVTIVRPMLEITREDVLSYCQQHKLSPRSDSSNLSLSFFRNRLRLELLPRLKDYNPGINEALLRLAKIASDDVSFIEEQAARLWAEVVREEGVIYLNRSKVASMPPALQRQIFRLVIARQLGDLRDFGADHIETMLSFLSKPTGKRLSLPRGLTLLTEYDQLVFLPPTQASSCPLPFFESEVSLNIPGKTALPGWLVKADVVKEMADSRGSFSANLDLDSTGNKLTVRRRRAGDRFQPLGMRYAKKLQDFMVDARVPQTWRDRVPLVCSPEQIVWVAGWRIDDRFKVTETTKKVLFLEFERLL